MSLMRERLLAEMGIAPLWVRRDAAPAEAETAMPVTVEAEASTALPLAVADEGSRVSAPEEPAPSLDAPVRATGDAPMDSPMTLAWPQLREAILSCRACPLCERRKQAVPGVGDMDAEWLFIGEGPGAEEDERGEPFVGQAGRLLDAMLGAIDLKRGDNVYIGPGAMLFGPIRIADDIAIGANAVVNRSFLEPGITIAGAPAMKISDHGSEGLVIRGTERVRSLRER